MFSFIGIALAGGFFMANQSPINADLRKIVRSPFLAASISNLVGSIFLALIALVLTGHFIPTGHFISSNPWWIWLGGICGGIFLTSNVILFAQLGAVQTVILPILGQIIMGTLIDSFGWFNVNQVPLSMMRLLGVLITVAGVVIAVILPSLRSNSTQQATKKRPLGWQIWAIIVGGISATQQAINGHLGVLLQNSPEASFVSFFIGFLLIFVTALIVDRRLPSVVDLKQTKPWNWIGGFLGGLFVLASVIAVPQIGAGLTIMAGLVGQILGSIFVQQFGWWKSMQINTNRFQIIGILVMIIGVVIVKFV